MNWDAVAAVGEMIGALAVVASLAYLAMQIRHNTREVEETNRAHELNTLSDIAGRFTHFRTQIINDAEVASIWQRGRDDLNSLSSEERFRFDNIACEFYWGFAMLFLYHGIGGIDEVSLKITIRNIDLWALTPGLLQWWNESPYRNDYPDAFIEHVSGLYQEYSKGG